jgi:protein involved in polysaccharide export with SLBB domain
VLPLGCQHAAVGSALPDAPPPIAELAPIPATTLGPGDVFEVRVFQEPDLSGVFRLAGDGSISFPLCGRIQLGGLTSTLATDQLTKCLAKGFLRDPQVSIFVREYNSKKIFVFGEVQKPGTFQYEDGMNIVQAITMAGGFAQHASKNSTSVTRLLDGTERRVKVAVEDIGLGRAENFNLRPGDIIFVPESLF